MKLIGLYMGVILTTYIQWDDPPRGLEATRFCVFFAIRILGDMYGLDATPPIPRMPRIWQMSRLNGCNVILVVTISWGPRYSEIPA